MRSKRLETVILMLLVTAFNTMVMGLLSYTATANTLRREITNAYQVSLMHIRDRMQTYLRHLDHATLQFEKNPEIERLVSEGPDLNLEPMSTLSLIERLQRIHAAAEHVDNVVLHDQRSEKLYASNPVMNRVYADYAGVLAHFRSLNEKRAFFNITVGGIPVTAYIRKVPAFGALQPLSIIFHINQSFYDDLLGKEKYSESGNYFILDCQGDVLAIRGSGEIQDIAAIVAQIKANAGKSDQTVVRSFSINETFITYLPIFYDGRIFGFSVPNDVFLYKPRNLRNLIFLAALTLLITSIVLSALSSHLLWKGWNRIKTTLDENHVDTLPPKTSEFDIVLTHIRTMVDQRAQLREQVGSLIPAFKDTFTLYLLDTGVRSEDDRRKAIDLNILPHKGAYCCFCVEIDQDSEPGVYGEKNCTSFEYAVFSVIKEKTTRWGRGHVVRVEDGLFAILVSSDVAHVSSFEEHVLTLARTILQHNAEHFSIPVSIGIGGVRTNYNHLNVSFREARDSLRDKYIYGGNRIFFSREINVAWPTVLVPIREMESDVLFGIKTVNKEYAYQALGQLRRLKGFPNLHYACLQTRLVETAHYIIRQTEKYLKVFDNHSELFTPHLEDFLHLRSLEDWELWFRKKCVDPIIELIRTKQQTLDERTVQAVRDYIRSHLENDLRLEECCSILRIPVSTVKSALRNIMGASFVDLVLAERIAQAKLWLTEGELCVETIARKLRYSNAQNFSRTFKKAVGIPPGRYRLHAIPSSESDS